MLESAVTFTYMLLFEIANYSQNPMDISSIQHKLLCSHCRPCMWCFIYWSKISLLPWEGGEISLSVSFFPNKSPMVHDECKSSVKLSVYFSVYTLQWMQSRFTMLQFLRILCFMLPESFKGMMGFFLILIMLHFLFYCLLFLSMYLSWNLKIGALLDAACRQKGNKY